MKIIIASDHAGNDRKKEIIEYIENNLLDVEYEDLGTNQEVGNYAKEGIKVGESIAMGKGDLGLVLCGTGIGISIAANKVKGIRAALCSTPEDAKLSRLHNDANVLALSGRYLSKEEAIAIFDKFIHTDFEGGRHLSRIHTITDYEESCIDC